MNPSTLPIAEAELRLSALVKEAQMTQQPVILTAEATAEPVALLTPLPSATSKQADAVARHLEIAEIILQLWQETPANSASYAAMLQSQLRLLSEAVPARPDSFPALLMLLRLALRQVRPPVSPAQLQVFQQGLTFLRAANLTVDQLATFDHALLEHGIDAQAELGDQTLLQRYVDAS